MNHELNEKLSASIQEFHLPRYDEIPEVGLYLEQTAKYISDYLKPLKDISITGSMISNYVKKKIVANPLHKQYNREQIAYLIFIAIAKSVLSLENIRLVIDMQKRSYDSRLAYNYFCMEFEDILGQVFGLRESKDLFPAERADISHEKNVLHNMIMTAAHKIYLDQYFSLLQTCQKQPAEDGK